MRDVTIHISLFVPYDIFPHSFRMFLGSISFFFLIYSAFNLYIYYVWVHTQSYSCNPCRNSACMHPYTLPTNTFKFSLMSTYFLMSLRSFFWLGGCKLAKIVFVPSLCMIVLFWGHHFGASLLIYFFLTVQKKRSSGY